MSDNRRLQDLEKKAKSKRVRSEDRADQARLRREAGEMWANVHRDLADVLEHGPYPEGHEDAHLHRSLKQRGFDVSKGPPEEWVASVVQDAMGGPTRRLHRPSTIASIIEASSSPAP